jgi:hypothetical protein
LRDWLDSRSPRPPAALSERLAELTAGIACDDEGEIPALLIGKACEVLTRIEGDRGAATDLLAADALITYAMEAAADSPQMGELASLAMLRIAEAAPR